MIVMGIDPGIANVGFGVIASDKSVIVSGTIRTNPRLIQQRRLYSIARRIKYLIEATNPDLVVVEEFIPFRQRKNMGNISQAFGAIQYVCEASSAELLVVRPNKWMRSVLGLTSRAKFSKLTIQRFIDKELGVKTQIEHEAEALGLALYGRRVRR